MIQLPESDIAFDARLTRLAELISAGCTHAELYTDLQVAISVRNG